MMYPPCTLYVIRCQTPNKWYVGSTYRQKHKRFDEHRAGYGSKWTARHGFNRSLTIPIDKGEYENDLWMHYARLYGPGTRSRPGCSPKSLGASASLGVGARVQISPADVLALHAGAVPHFLLELLRGVDLLGRARHLQHAD